MRQPEVDNKQKILELLQEIALAVQEGISCSATINHLAHVYVDESGFLRHVPGGGRTVTLQIHLPAR